MAEKHFNFHHGCNKSQFTADEMVRVTVEMTDQIQLHCLCQECGNAHILDISQKSDDGFRQLLRRMFVRQAVITVPDEVFDSRRLAEDSLVDFAIQFHTDLQRLPDDLVAHRELQNDWEALTVTGQDLD